MRVYFCTKFYVSGITRTRFRQGEVILPHPTPIPKQTPKKPTLIRVKKLYFALNYNSIEFTLKCKKFKSMMVKRSSPVDTTLME